MSRTNAVRLIPAMVILAVGFITVCYLPSSDNSAYRLASLTDLSNARGLDGMTYDAGDTDCAFSNTLGFEVTYLGCNAINLNTTCIKCANTSPILVAGPGMVGSGYEANGAVKCGDIVYTGTCYRAPTGLIYCEYIPPPSVGCETGPTNWLKQ